MQANAPVTEGIKYAGSKLRLLPYILELARKVRARTVLDGFSGTTRVAQALALSGYGVLANDLAVWSEIFATCYLLNNRPRRAYRELIDHLNAVPPDDGWFTEHYGGLPANGTAVQSDGRKRPWQIHNTRKLDAIRTEIDRLDLAANEKAVALTSLILALDAVDNTLGHFAAYLRQWSPRSYRPLRLRMPRLIAGDMPHRVVRGDIFDLLENATADLAYFDPPYGSNNDKMPPSRIRYAAYYHLWTTVCLNDRPALFGRAGRRADTADPLAASVFEDFRRDADGCFKALRAIDRLLDGARARWIILSYSSGGRATAAELDAVIAKHGRLREIMSVTCRRHVMAEMQRTRAWLRDADTPHREFLFLIEKN